MRGPCLHPAIVSSRDLDRGERCTSSGPRWKTNAYAVKRALEHATVGRIHKEARPFALRFGVRGPRLDVARLPGVPWQHRGGIPRPARQRRHLADSRLSPAPYHQRPGASMRRRPLPSGRAAPTPPAAPVGSPRIASTVLFLPRRRQLCGKAFLGRGPCLGQPPPCCGPPSWPRDRIEASSRNDARTGVPLVLTLTPSCPRWSPHLEQSRHLPLHVSQRLLAVHDDSAHGGVGGRPGKPGIRPPSADTETASESGSRLIPRAWLSLAREPSTEAFASGAFCPMAEGSCRDRARGSVASAPAPHSPLGKRWTRSPPNRTQARQGRDVDRLGSTTGHPLRTTPAVGGACIPARGL